MAAEATSNQLALPLPILWKRMAKAFFLDDAEHKAFRDGEDSRFYAGELIPGLYLGRGEAGQGLVISEKFSC